jgi:probable F420-dependent oxidoreductase
MPPIKFSFELPTTRIGQVDEFASGEAITEITRAAAAAGFSAVNLTDHPAPDTRWLDTGGHHAYDPFVALAFAATADPNVLLQTNIYVAGYRNPFLGAKSVQSLDVLSGGRVILGVAAGYLKPEFNALGANFDNRGALLDEALEVLTEVMSGADTARDGAASSYHARGVRLRPVPDRGRPPVWVGGNSRAAIRRASRYDGWAPFCNKGFAAARTDAMESIDDVARGIGFVRECRGESADEPFDVCWADAGLSDASRSADERLGELADLAAIGVSWVVVSSHGSDRAEVLEAIAAYGRDVIAAV